MPLKTRGREEDAADSAIFAYRFRFDANRLSPPRGEIPAKAAHSIVAGGDWARLARRQESVVKATF
jgi:hypothetical protein